MGGRGQIAAGKSPGKSQTTRAEKQTDGREKKNKKTGELFFFDSFSSLVSQSLFGSVFLHEIGRPAELARGPNSYLTPPY